MQIVEYKRFKGKNTGITLIALVVTIIVLLILAGITLAMLTGQNGVITKARESKSVSRRGEIIERIKLDISDKQIEKASNNDSKYGSLTEEELETILQNYGTVNKAEDGTIESLTSNDPEVKEPIPISEIWNGTIIASDSESGNEGITADDIAKDATNTFGKTVTGYDYPNSASNMEWQIFYAGNDFNADGDTSNHIYLISKDYLDYNYAPKGRNGTTLYRNSGSDYRLSMDDVINDYNGSSDITDSRLKNLNGQFFNGGKSSSNANMKAVAYMMDTSVWNVFKGESAEYAIGGPTIELLFKAYNTKHKYDNKYQTRATSNVGYEISTNSGSNWNAYITNSADYLSQSDTEFVHAQWNNVSYMWVASPSSNDAYYVMIVYDDGGVGDGSYSGSNYRFSPVSLSKI